MATDFIVDRGDLSRTSVVDVPVPQVGPSDVLLRVERFALTANNITYGVAGDVIGYWQFFPADGDWGRIPVWGIGRVEESPLADLPPGTQVYGYFPMSEYLLVTPENVSPRGFVDAAEHRAALPAVYNHYSVMNEANGFEPAYQNHYMIYRPLFTTSFVLDDYLEDNDFFGADNVLLGSASSKTAFGLAYLLHARGNVRVAGLTSAANASFVRGLGLYHDVFAYDDIESLERRKTVYVDMAGNRDVLARVHQHYVNDLVASCGVGITHWQARDGADPSTLPGAKPTMFFAPAQIAKRQQEEGAAAYQARIAEATNRFLGDVDQWVTIEERPFADVAQVYAKVLAGAQPDRGYVVTLT